MVSGNWEGAKRLLEPPVGLSRDQQEEEESREQLMPQQPRGHSSSPRKESTEMDWPAMQADRAQHGGLVESLFIANSLVRNSGHSLKTEDNSIGPEATTP